MSLSADASTSRWRRDALAVFAAALAARLAVVLWAGTRFPPAADGAYYDVIARRIADGHGYTWVWSDGVVTYAAHYPIGLPALLAVVYRFFGTDPRLPGALFGIVGALAAVAVQGVAREVTADRRVGRIAGLLFALHPGLVLYTTAFMTEGVTAALVAFALVPFVSAQRHGTTARARVLAVGLLGVIVGVATLFRPQVLVLAPLLGAAIDSASWRLRGVRAVAALGIALAVCAPWTVRNCQRMGRCALVSYNGGFNLLIGTDAAARGGWAEVKVPVACREVFDEADKDACFGREAARDIVADPWLWIRLAPAKLARTFDYVGAGPWYLHESNPRGFSAIHKTVAGVIETVYERLVLIACAVEAGRRARARFPRSTLVLGLLAVGFACVEHAFVSVLALLGLWILCRVSAPRTRAFDLAALAVVGSTVVIHAAFFGAGRYALVVVPVVTVMGALLAARSPPVELGSPSASAEDRLNP